MKERIKTFRFTCDGWYYDEYNDTVYCQSEPVTVTLTGTKDEVENELSSLGWKEQYLYGSAEYLCPREHFGDTWTPDSKVRHTEPVSYKRLIPQRPPEPELTDDEKIDRFFQQ